MLSPHVALKILDRVVLVKKGEIASRALEILFANLLNEFGFFVARNILYGNFSGAGKTLGQVAAICKFVRVDKDKGSVRCGIVGKQADKGAFAGSGVATDNVYAICMHAVKQPIKRLEAKMKEGFVLHRLLKKLGTDVR